MSLFKVLDAAIEKYIDGKIAAAMKEHVASCSGTKSVAKANPLPTLPPVNAAPVVTPAVPAAVQTPVPPTPVPPVVTQEQLVNSLVPPAQETPAAKVISDEALKTILNPVCQGGQMEAVYSCFQQFGVTSMTELTNDQRVGLLSTLKGQSGGWDPVMAANYVQVIGQLGL